MNAGINSPKVRKATKRRLAKEKLQKENKLENKTAEEIEVIVNHEVALEDSHPRGEKPKYFGEVTEMDGSNHLWFGDKKSCLHLAADEATNHIVGGYFDWQETLNGYYHVYEGYITYFMSNIELWCSLVLPILLKLFVLCITMLNLGYF